MTYIIQGFLWTLGAMMAIYVSLCLLAIVIYVASIPLPEDKEK